MFAVIRMVTRFIFASMIPSSVPGILIPEDGDKSLILTSQESQIPISEPSFSKHDWCQPRLTTSSYPESSGSFASGWLPGETLKNSKKFQFLNCCPVTACIVLTQSPAVPQSFSWRPTAGQIRQSILKEVTRREGSTSAFLNRVACPDDVIFLARTISAFPISASTRNSSLQYFQHNSWLKINEHLPISRKED